MSNKCLIWTDGSYSRVDGTGGYAAILLADGIEKEVGGFAYDTTNQRMEMRACIAALEALNERIVLRDGWSVTIYSDSAYVVNCFQQQWIPKWRSRDWRNSKNKPVDNQDLWERLEDLVNKYDVEFVHVKGHSGHALNERVDRLAHKARIIGKERRLVASL